MRDGIALARLNIASVALVTSEFWDQANFVARSAGMPSAPRIRLPHPVAGTGSAAMAQVAKNVVSDAAAAFSGAAQ